MRIGMDIDGVLYHWSDTARFLLEYHRGVHLGESTSWNYIQENVSPDDWNWLWSEGVRRGLYRHGHIYRGAVEGMMALSRVGHLVIISSRPPAATQDTLEWLSYHRFPVREVHIIDKVSKSSVEPQCDLYVDDSEETVQDLLENTQGEVAMWDRPWNQKLHTVIREGEVEEVLRVQSWPELLTLAEKVRKNGTRIQRQPV